MVGAKEIMEIYTVTQMNSFPLNFHQSCNTLGDQIENTLGDQIENLAKRGS